jgi:Tfp pilus assembly protein PilF
MILKRIPVVVIPILLAMGCATSSPNHSKDDQLRNWMDLAAASLAENDAVAALKALDEAEKINPETPQISYMRTSAYHTRHDFPRAIASIKKFLAAEPSSSDGQLTLGILMMETDKPDQALQPLMAAADDPKYERTSQAKTNLGILFYRKGNYKESENWFSKAIEDSPATACVAYYYRGHIRLKEARFKEAKEAYEQSTRKFCGAFAEGFLALGIAYQQLREYDHARKTYLEVQNRFPDTKIAEQAMERLKKLP